MSLPFDTLRQTSQTRQREWDPDAKTTLTYRANELGGETGEAVQALIDVCYLVSHSGQAQNIAKKLEREGLGMRGSKARLDDLAAELADVVICADLLADRAGIDLGAAVARKFNATSEKYGLQTRLPAPPDAPA